MKKILIEASITNNDEKEIYEVEAEKSADKYKYIESNEFKTKVEYNYKKQTLRRENEQVFMEFNFKTEEAIILLKENEKEMIIPIEILSINNNKVEYKLEDQHFLYEIKEK